VVDALRRRVHELHDTTIIMYQSYLKDRFVEAAKSDLQYMELVTNCSKVKCNRRLRIMNWELMKSSCAETKFMYPTLLN
jgi:hypothetical protein